MKKLLMSLTVIAAVIAGQTAFADNQHHRGGYNGFRGGHHFTGSRHYYGSRSYHRDSHFNVSFGSHHGYGHSRYRHYDAGAFVGGLVLGSLISYPRYHSPRYETVRYVNRPVSRSREVVYVQRPVTREQPATAASGRRLLRDLEGNCFERVVDENGDEISIQLDPAECAF